MNRRMYCPVMSWYEYDPTPGKFEIVEWGNYEWGEYPDAPKCPKCGAQADYTENTMDQDEQGNDINGWGYDCPNCCMSTYLQEF